MHVHFAEDLIILRVLKFCCLVGMLTAFLTFSEHDTSGVLQKKFYFHSKFKNVMVYQILCAYNMVYVKFYCLRIKFIVLRVKFIVQGC